MTQLLIVTSVPEAGCPLQRGDLATFMGIMNKQVRRACILRLTAALLLLHNPYIVYLNHLSPRLSPLGNSEQHATQTAKHPGRLGRPRHGCLL